MKKDVNKWRVIYTYEPWHAIEKLTVPPDFSPCGLGRLDALKTLILMATPSGFSPSMHEVGLGT